jgi:hypothetical protein
VDDADNFKDNLWGNEGANKAAQVVHETSEKDGDLGNFDFAKDSESSTESVGYKTVASTITTRRPWRAIEKV